MTKYRSERYIVCPNPHCGYRGQPRRGRRRTKGWVFALFFVGVGLLFLCWPVGLAMIIGAVVVDLAAMGDRPWHCPACGQEVTPTTRLRPLYRGWDDE